MHLETWLRLRARLESDLPISERDLGCLALPGLLHTHLFTALHTGSLTPLPERQGSLAQVGAGAREKITILVIKVANQLLPISVTQLLVCEVRTIVATTSEACREN